ncbi:unnamed protein product [Prorocentrum cordatum]|uniref:F-box domain-containing protein n=1 Tax=Prorocentrum cordatum TaxID=2364126 RepID=A0ABN9SSY8_9DINO|nr:unnamed protein product [Polarella glacialis]
MDCAENVIYPCLELRASATVSVLDAISEEVMQQLCLCLPGRELIRFSAAARPLKELVSSSDAIWKRLVRALLGEPYCHLHAALAAKANRITDTEFWRTLFRHGQELRVARWAPSLRSAFLGCSPGAQPDAEAAVEAAKERASQAVVGSGHCSVGIGNRVVKIGGLRPSCDLEHLHAAIFDLTALTIHELELTEDSQKPERRLRHAACEIRPAVTNSRPAVLVLGGCHDQTKQPCKGGLKLLHILELFDDKPALGRWHSLEAHGEAPAAIWHHICGAFASGTRVVVSGGDFPSSDPEFVHITNRSVPASFVYLLDVMALSWERVQTTGPAPTWRSLHAGFTHVDISSHSERLVILGGCAEHLPIFSSSDDLEHMIGHALDLRSFQWLPQPQNRGSWSLPPARLRLASEKIGEWLLLYGGRSSGDAIRERARLFKLNLRTLAWDALEVRGREGSHPAAPAATMSAGLVIWGTVHRIRHPDGARLDVLTLWSPDGESGADDGQEEEPESEEEDDSPRDAVSVLVRDSQGNARRMVLSRTMLQLLLARQARGGQPGQSDDED